jgi:membrane-associated protease RseP (regulator of RpoE activity)
VAGWFGFFFTMLNLLPAGQLDGGHVLYALFGRAQQIVGAIAVVALLWLGQGWSGWWFWAAAILVLGRGRVSHPAVLDDVFRPRGWRIVAGWACIVIALLTFIPRPL